MQAATIVQDGVIRAPIGSLTLGGDVRHWRSRTTGFRARSRRRTRYSDARQPAASHRCQTDGLVIPYGTTTDQIEWYFAPTTSNPLTSPPPAILQLGGANINVSNRLRRWISKAAATSTPMSSFPGRADRAMLLSQYNTDSFSANDGYQYPDHRQVYAIVPGLSNAAVVRSDLFVQLRRPLWSEPSRQAGLPQCRARFGGRMVYPVAGPVRHAAWRDAGRSGHGSGLNSAAGRIGYSVRRHRSVVSGYYGVAGSGAIRRPRSVFDVQSQAVIRSYSDIALTYGNQTFTADAAHSGVTTPRLPIDAGRLILAPETSLVLSGTFDTTPATGGRGSEVDIGGADLDIVDRLAARGVAGRSS